MLPESFFFMPCRARSAVSRLRLFISTWSAILSASGLFSMKYTSNCALKNSVIEVWMKRLFIAFFVWFSYEVCVEKQFVTSIRQSCTSWNFIAASFFWYLPDCFIYASIAEVKASFTALSGAPPFSSQEEL